MAAPAGVESVMRRLSTLDRLLPLWIFVAMALGIALGRVFPDLGAALDRVQVAGVSVPIAFGLLWMRRALDALLMPTPAAPRR
jgi:arsenite transporter